MARIRRNQAGRSGRARLMGEAAHAQTEFANERQRQLDIREVEEESGSPFKRDPLGLALKQRAREYSAAALQGLKERNAIEALQNPALLQFNSLAESQQAQANAQMDASGFGGFFQAIHEAAERGAGPGARVRFRGGPSADGSTQIRGESVQPDYLGTRAIPGGIAGNPDWWQQGERPATTIPQIEQRMQQMPASLHGLYAASFAPKKRRT